MTASTELLIGDAGGPHVLVRAVSRHHPQLFDARDDSSIHCDVEIVAGGFRAAFQADSRSEDFQSFLDEAEALTRSLDGVASFATPEGQLALTLTGDGAGRVRLQGEALDAPGSANRLRFGLEIDQGDVPQICRSLALLLAAFPVIGKVDV